MDYYKYVDRTGELIKYNKNQVSGKKIKTKNSVMFSKALISIITDKNEEKLQISVIAINTWYGIPKKLGKDCYGLSKKYSGDSLDFSSKYRVYQYEGYMKDGLFGLKKKSDKNISIATVATNTYDRNFDSIISSTTKLHAYLSKNDKRMNYKYNKPLKDKKYDYNKVKKISTIMSAQYDKYSDDYKLEIQSFYFHRVKSLDKKNCMLTSIPASINPGHNYNYDYYDEMQIPTTFCESDTYLAYDFEGKDKDIYDRLQ